MQEQEVVTTNEEVTPQEQEAKVDPFVEKAMELGWRPQEEWDGAPEDFIEAKEFVRRQPLFDKISGLSKTVKQLEQALDAFKVHHSRVKENEYNRALEQLKKARRQAISDGEAEQALQIEDKIEEIEGQKQDFEEELRKQPQTSRSPDPAFTSWMQANPWYQKDRAMTAFADKLGIELKQSGMSNDEILVEVTKEVRAEFKHKFTNPKREAPSAVEAGGRKAAKAADETDTSGMTEQDIQIMNRIVRSGAMTKAEYLKEYKSLQ